MSSWIKFILNFLRVEIHHTFEVINVTLTLGAPKACMSINFFLYNIYICFYYFYNKTPQNNSTSVDVGVIWSQVAGMLSLQQWQSYLGLILVEKEETLAASSRLHSTFVSKFTKTEIKKRGGWQSWGGRQVLGNRQTERRRRRGQGDSRHTQQGKHFSNAKKVYLHPILQLSLKILFLKVVKTTTQNIADQESYTCF